MKKGLNLWSVMWPGSEGAPSWEGLVKIVKDIGYDGIEFTYDEKRIRPQDLDRNQRSSYLEIVKSQGMEIPSVATGVFWQCNPAGQDANGRQHAIELGKLGLDLASDLEAKVLLVVPAVNVPELAYQKVWDHSVNFIRALASHAEQVGVTVGVENVWNRFLYSPVEFRKFVESAGSDQVKAYLDVGNILELGYPTQWIRELKGMVACVHVKDFDLSVGGLSGFRHLKHGDVDWPSVMKELRGIGYDGYLNVECFPSFDPTVASPTFQDAVSASKGNSSALDGIIAS
jgi:L-ribulose-5-phosphate 3-epimerase